MKYAIQERNNGLTVNRIAPLDAHIVRINISWMTAQYQAHTPEVLLELYQRLYLTGTQRRTKEGLEMYLKQYGIEISLSSSTRAFHLAVTCRKERVTETLRILIELIEQPLLSTTELKLKKKTFLEENREARDDAARIAEIIFRDALYSVKSPLHVLTLDAEREHIACTTARSLTSLKDELTRSECVVSIVGDSYVQRTLEIFLARISRKSTALIHSDTVQPLHPSASFFKTVPAKTNIELRIGNRVPLLPREIEYDALSFGLSVLGKMGGFSGRLMSTVREKEGLTYSIYASLASSHRETYGHWYIYTFFAAKDLERGLTSVSRELERLVAHGITLDELKTFKEILSNQYQIAHGSNAHRISFYHNAALRGESPAELAESIKRMNGLSRRSVNAAVARYIDPTQLVISGAGPVTSDGKGII